MLPIEIESDLATLLNEGNFAEVIRRGYNVLTFEPMEQVDVLTLLDMTGTKYLNRYSLRPK